MKVRIRIVLKIVIALFIACAISLTLLYLLFRPFIIEGKKTRHRNVRLLCEADHQALLDACREISRMVTKGDLRKYHYNIRINPDPETSRFPKPILDLEPTHIYIDDKDGRVMVELGGGLHHFGVYAYPDDYREPFHGFKYGDRELTAGLWYYNDGYHEKPDYYKNIEALLEKKK